MAAEIYELVVSGTLVGQFVQSVFHIGADNAGDEPPYDVAEAILDSVNVAQTFVDKWCNLHPDTYFITSLRCRRVKAAGGPTAIMLPGAMVNSQGGRVGPISSAAVNPVLVWLTTLNPAKPGRTFVVGIAEADIDAMVYTAPWLVAAEALITAVKTPMTLALGSIVCSFGIYRRVLLQCNDITNGRVSPVVGTQRRRLHPV